MGGASKTVVRDDAVGDEVTGSGGDVVERQGTPERLDRRDLEVRERFQHLPLNRSLAGDRGIGEVEEAELL